MVFLRLKGIKKMFKIRYLKWIILIYKNSNLGNNKSFYVVTIYP